MLHLILDQLAHQQCTMIASRIVATTKTLGRRLRRHVPNKLPTAASSLLSLPQSHSLSPFSSASTTTNNIDDGRLAALQKKTWNTYLANGRGSEALFASIDTDLSQAITVDEIRFFLDAIGHRGVHPRAFRMLDEFATRADHKKIGLREFKSWLVLATKLGNGKNTSYVSDYESHPNVGERQRRSRTKKAAAARAENQEDEDTEYYSWNEVTMSQNVRRMQYAVRGSVVMKADALKAQGRDILYTNIGNPQAVEQDPITYYRQVLALCDLPAKDGVDHPLVEQLFPKDVVARAREMRSAIGDAGTGAYTHSQGVLEFRKHVAQYIIQRDGHPSYPGNIFLTNGASTGIELVLNALIASDLDGIMIPIPQYPIYSALIAKLGGRQVPYYLDEERNWAVSAEELEGRLEEAREEGLAVKALAIINPGNPTGQVYTREDLEVVCKFCSHHGIVLLADEVYQRNIYADNKSFISAKKVGMETEGCENLEVVSFHSTSKGFIGECGRRGGYMELHNIDPYVQSQLYKLASSGLCSNLGGQVMTSLMMKPPVPGDLSYEQFHEEESSIYDGLKRRAKAVVEGLNRVDGISCNAAEGAMYTFPSIQLPQGAIDAAEEENTTPDVVYALSLLEETGICVVPASGFGQKEGRYGFRTTFLPPDAKMMAAIDLFASHHKTFCERYS